MDYLLRIVPFILEHEGAWADHPQDKGGPTFCGLTLKNHPYFRDKVKELALEANKTLPDFALAFYYYLLGRKTLANSGIEEQLEKLKPVYLQELEQYQPPFLCNHFPLWSSYFDAAFVHGSRNAVKILQRALNSRRHAPYLLVDGILGPRTQASLSSVDFCRLVQPYNLSRIRFILELSQFPVFGRGWVNRVIDLIFWLDKEECYG